MLAIQRILVPVERAEDSRCLVRQVAWMARRFRAEVLLLHALAPLDYPFGMSESAVEQSLNEVLDPELADIRVTHLLLKGYPDQEIIRTAAERETGLIMMGTHGEGPIAHLLLGSNLSKVLRETSCPVWILPDASDANVEEIREAQSGTAPSSAFSVRRVLCSVELDAHGVRTLRLAAEMAASLGAVLTVAHITDSAEKLGPGGTLVDKPWRDELVAIAQARIAAMQSEAGTGSDVVIHSGNVPELLSLAAIETRADLLIIGHHHGRSHLGDNGNGYSIIRRSLIPVLSVV